MFDERKDYTKTPVEAGLKGQFEVKKIENCSVVIFSDKVKEVNNEEEKNENEVNDNDVSDTEETVKLMLTDNKELKDPDTIEEVLNKVEWSEVEDEHLGVETEEVEVGPKTGEDEGEYLGHCQPLEGTGRAVAQILLDHLRKYECDLKLTLTDGTSKMTGSETGAVTVIEQTLQKPLQRGVCL